LKRVLNGSRFSIHWLDLGFLGWVFKLIVGSRDSIPRVHIRGAVGFNTSIGRPDDYQIPRMEASAPRNVTPKETLVRETFEVFKTILLGLERHVIFRWPLPQQVTEEFEAGWISRDFFRVLGVHPSLPIKPLNNGMMQFRSNWRKVWVSPHLHEPHEPHGSTVGLFRVSAEQEHGSIKFAQNKLTQVHTGTIRQ
jgi:hypothetical protein